MQGQVLCKSDAARLCHLVSGLLVPDPMLFISIDGANVATGYLP